MSAGHDHTLPATTQERSLRWALVLTSAVLIAEVVGSVVLNSLALLLFGVAGYILFEAWQRCVKGAYLEVWSDMLNGSA